MLVGWGGETPPDARAWIDVLHTALGKKDSPYWVRFYRKPEGWRFDLEYHQAAGSGPTYKQAGERIALRVYTLLVESGKPLDPGWRPSAPSPATVTVRKPTKVPALTAPPVAEAAPTPSGEAPPPPVAEAAPVVSLTALPEPVRETRTESVEATLAAPVPEPEPFSEQQPPPAPRPSRWGRLRPVVVSLPAVLLVAVAGWLSWDRLQSRHASTPAPTLSARVSQEALAAEKRLKEVEPVVAELKQERAQVLPGGRAAARTPTHPTRRASGQPLTQPVGERAGEILAPTPAPEPTATPVTAPPAAPASSDVPSPTDPTVLTDAAVTTPVSAAAAEPPPMPSPVRPGAIVDANDPGLTLPVPLTQTRPRYPPLALERRVTGTVWLRALIDETGAVVQVSLVRAYPRDLFEDAATSYVRTRVYRPATKQGVPVRVWLPIVVEFRLPGR